MKRKILLFLALFFVTGRVNAQVYYDFDDFADENFQDCIVSSVKEYVYELSFPEDLHITEQDISNLERLDCSGRNITDISGIERLTSVVKVDLSDNSLTSLELLETSTNNTIEELDVSRNSISGLDLTGLPGLQKLNLQNNHMTHLYLKNYIPTLYIVGNDFLDEVNINLRSNSGVDIDDYIKFDNVGASDNSFSVEYTIDDETIASVNSNKIFGKKVGRTSADLVVKNGDNVIYSPTLLMENSYNSIINVSNQCLPVMSGAKRYTITFDVDGLASIGETFNFSESLESEKLNLPVPERDGYKFIGWYTDKDLKNEAVIKTYADVANLENINDEECSSEFIVKLYAKWEAVVDNPKTGIKTSLILDAGIILISGIAYLVVVKKNKYSKI